VRDTTDRSVFPFITVLHLEAREHSSWCEHHPMVVGFQECFSNVSVQIEIAMGHVQLQLSETLLSCNLSGFAKTEHLLERHTRFGEVLVRC